MTEYKPGDRFKVLKDDADGATVKAGDLGTVVEFNESEIEAKMDNPRGRGWTEEFDWYLTPENIELVDQPGEVTAELVSGPDLLRSLAEAASELNLGVLISFYPMTENSGSEE